MTSKDGEQLGEGDTRVKRGARLLDEDADADVGEVVRRVGEEMTARQLGGGRVDDESVVAQEGDVGDVGVVVNT